MTKRKIQVDVDEVREFTAELGEHEFGLCFNSDLQCAQFSEWLNLEGWKRFQEWLSEADDV